MAMLFSFTHLVSSLLVIRSLMLISINTQLQIFIGQANSILKNTFLHSFSLLFFFLVVFFLSLFFIFFCPLHYYLSVQFQYFFLFVFPSSFCRSLRFHTLFLYLKEPSLTACHSLGLSTIPSHLTARSREVQTVLLVLILPVTRAPFHVNQFASVYTREEGRGRWGRRRKCQPGPELGFTNRA